MPSKKTRTQLPAPDPSAHPVPSVSEKNGVLTMHFQAEYVQSQMLSADPGFLTLAYARNMMAFEQLTPDARSIALIGLGGGGLAKWIHRHHPRAKITVVEINPHVIALRDRFHIPPDSRRFRILCADGIDFVVEQAKDLDVLLVDGFDLDSVPDALCSVYFYSACYRALSANGLLVVNLCGYNRRIAQARLRRIFAGRILSARDKNGNTVVYACKGDLLWPKNATGTFLSQARIAFEKKHALARALKPI
ncbi:transferase [Silvibacterium sp.]|uniref:spermine/spermidine synthase domain-containing protein n=1 Tax=Silvibacterium sp. TaxID=1964179 RepID=UPI0039E2B8D8